MLEINTKYGRLSDISRYSAYPDGQLDSAVLESEHVLKTSVGALIPRYEDFTGRRKTTKSLSFFPDGQLKTIDLQEKTPILTPLGLIDAELITFYESGAIKRIFPLNGAINGMWSIEDESELVKKISLHILGIDLELKIDSIYFYPDGKIRSISFFPDETAVIPTPIGSIPVVNGFLLDSKGKLVSAEPASPVEIPTPVGTLHAYNCNAIGIHADTNSLLFNDSKVVEFVSSTDVIRITDNNEEIHHVAPSYISEDESVDGTFETFPFRVLLGADSVTFKTYEKEEFTILFKDIKKIEINTIPATISNCTDCSTCGLCFEQEDN